MMSWDRYDISHDIMLMMSCDRYDIMQETLFELYSERKKVILCELMKTLESQVIKQIH